MIEDLRFERIGIFPYSNERGAESYDFENQVPDEVKQRRFEELYQLAEEISLENNKKLVDAATELDMYIDGYDDEEGLFFGRSYRECLEVDPKIFVTVKDPENVVMGDMIHVRIIGCDDYDVYAEEL